MTQNNQPRMIQAAKAVGLLIDLQERLVPVMAQSDALIARTVTLIQGLRVLDVPILSTRQYTRGLGETVPPIREALGEEDSCEKLTCSCCAEPTLMARLPKDRTDVILFGIEAHICVAQTACDLLDLGRQVWVVTDCISSRSLQDKEIAIHRMIQEGVRPATTESILFELLRKAEGETFKQISRLIK